MVPRYLRFARTVALVTSAVAAGCHDDGAPAVSASDTGGRDPIETGGDDVLADATDAADGSDGDAVTEGTCRILILDGDVDLACEAGSMCSYPESDAGDGGDVGDGDPVLCTYGIDAAAPEGGVAECGLVTCGANCYCAGPAISLCGCLHLGSAGPLAPPELPIATRERRRSPRRA